MVLHFENSSTKEQMAPALWHEMPLEFVAYEGVSQVHFQRKPSWKCYELALHWLISGHVSPLVYIMCVIYLQYMESYGVPVLKKKTLHIAALKQKVTCHFVVAADGLKSRLRGQLLGDGDPRRVWLPSPISKSIKIL